MRNPLLWCVFVSFYGHSTHIAMSARRCRDHCSHVYMYHAHRGQTSLDGASTLLHTTKNLIVSKRIRMSTHFIDYKNEKISEWKGKQRANDENVRKNIPKILLLLPHQILLSISSWGASPAMNNSNNNNDNEYWSRFLALAEYACILVVCRQPLLCLPPPAIASHSPNADRKSSRVSGLQREACYLRWPIPKLLNVNNFRRH